MPPDLTRELVTDLRAWYEDNKMSQRDLAGKLGLSPQQLAEIFARRNRPTGEQVLKIQEFLRTNNMKTDFLDPRATPRPTAGNPGPKTLTEARERIEVLEAQLLQLRGAAPKPVLTVPAPTTKPQPVLTMPAPKAKAQPAGDPGTDPVYPPTHTPGGDRPNPVPMPVNPPATPKKALPVTADTPFLIGEILKVTSFGDLLSMLDNPVHTPIQQSAIYKEVKARRQLVANRFE